MYEIKQTKSNLRTKLDPKRLQEKVCILVYQENGICSNRYP